MKDTIPCWWTCYTFGELDALIEQNPHAEMWRRLGIARDMRGWTSVSPYELPDHEQGPIPFIGSSSGVRQSGKPDGNGIISAGHALIWRIERKQTSS